MYGVSGMDSATIRQGRPFGGCAIAVKNSLKCRVTRVNSNCKSLCAVIIEISHVAILLINVYLPCDTLYDHTAAGMYADVLNDVEFIVDSHPQVNCILIGGDFNVDLKRPSLNQSSLLAMCERQCFKSGVLSNTAKVDFTYENEFSGARSIIDHFFVSEPLFQRVTAYYSASEGDNLSDHAALFMCLSIPHEHFVFNERHFNQKKPSWARATEEHKNRYQQCLRDQLSRVEVPYEAIHCERLTCDHSALIARYHDDIIKCCTLAASRAIPMHSKRGWSGWNEHAAQYKEAACFWQRIWVANGRPRTGWVSDVRNKSRREYKRVVQWLSRNQEKLRASRMADACASNVSRDFWGEVKKANRKRSDYPNMVDGVTGETAICEHFSDKYRALYNSVSYDQVAMDELCSKLSKGCSNACYDDHRITVDDVVCAVKKLKPSKGDSVDALSSDNFIYACRELFVHISLFLITALRHADVPNTMSHSIIVPIVKNVKKSPNDGNNYRSVAISSTIGKIFDKIVLVKHGEVLKTNELQFGFRAGLSTTMCTFVLNEIESYYSQLNAPLYITLLDASRAFDRVNFVKLFTLLLERNICKTTAKFLLSMYITQTMSVRWCNEISSHFTCSNGVKQGAVVSPVLFSVYMDVLLNRLSALNIGCRIGGQYVGALCYADDLTLLAPTRSAAQRMLQTCEVFAAEFDVLFNGQKSVSLIINPKSRAPVDLSLNGQAIPRVDSALHLGHYIGVGNHSSNVKKAISDLCCRVNGLSINFKHCSFDSIVKLFESHCTSFYGCPLWDITNVNRLEVCWRKCLRRLFRLPPRTHCSLLPLLLCKPELKIQLLMRCAKFMYNCYKSSNYVVRLCTNQSLLSQSISNRNLTLIKYVLHRDVHSLLTNSSVHNLLYNVWFSSCNASDVDNSQLLIELMSIRDGHYDSPLDKSEVNHIIEFLCVE